MKLLSFSLLLLMLAACQPTTQRSDGQNKVQQAQVVPVSDRDSRLDLIKLPPGFTIDIFADNLPNARSITRSPSGTIFVSTRDAGKVYAVRDTNGDNVADQKWTVLSWMHMPNGVAFKDGDLYVAEVSRLWRLPDIDNRLDQPQKELIVENYPNKDHHGWKYIAFGPDDKLYIPVGAPCNVCESADHIFASITRIDLASKSREIV